ncbi:thioredoxin [Desulfobacter hydrogenophilus]|uniref:Thioredoxin n=2 Tax=Desulfobacter hydrogenophilus TaxID=2291 RepID=A0A328FJK3_9BACT|nr:thioredoxin family protein [Desulfobacter hydrogenophilus]QBH15542.1 thioredoxin [Desulfobacter hydrogenophilus]RAM03095.1 thioredoxin [Desulfobacter hydrogenophilus]
MDNPQAQSITRHESDLTTYWNFHIKFIFLAVISAFLFALPAHAQNFSKIPEKGTVTMIDLGAKKCIPCKMMAPIIAKLEKAYSGKADIVFIDVWENRGQARRFKISAIPTQIFFNEKGEEVWRHVGFMDEKAIVDQMKKMGVGKPDFKNKG